MLDERCKRNSQIRIMLIGASRVARGWTPRVALVGICIDDINLSLLSLHPWLRQDMRVALHHPAHCLAHACGAPAFS